MAIVQELTNLAAAFGLSTSAGLNAYIPLLVVALAARYTDLITLREPWDALTSGWVIGVLVILLLIEILVDKIPAVDSINDVIQTIVRPVAGAILFAASSNVISDIHPVLALICGLILAGGVHAVKATARPAITGLTGGAGNALVSTAEDLLSTITSLLAVLFPVLLAILLILCVLIIGWWLWRRERARSAV
ncbi:MAG: DUF4126 domain-containing protein [Anaerolineae bacterium]|jgi:hypothetical protein|nr:DUF4126 domain-containing protein [Anaerolineae bacterium]MDH7474379.1 DUF4126 domain-containing protein [Anaerolineae bacterium]